MHLVQLRKIVNELLEFNETKSVKDCAKTAEPYEWTRMVRRYFRRDRGFEDSEAFKLYVLDIGLHGAMAGLEAKTLIEGNRFFGQYKGALTEQFVLQTIVSMQGFRKHYWTPDEGIAEVDFVVQKGNRVIPIEVKAEQNLRAKSLHEFEKRYKPSLIIRTSLAKYKKGDNILDLPLYAISLIDEF